jgi:hypothetical protein
MAIDIASILKQIARDGSQGVGNSFYYLLDGADIDFKVEGFIKSTGVSGPNANVENTLGRKYIVLDADGLTNAGINSSVRQAGIFNNDIIEKRSSTWGIHMDASLAGNARGGSGGALAYSVPEKSFYYYDSTAWKKFGSGSVDVNSLTAGTAIGISAGADGVLYFNNLGVTGIKVGETTLTGNVSLTNGTSTTITVAGNQITIGVDTGSLGGNFFVGDGFGNRDQVDLGQSLTFAGSAAISVSGSNNQLTFFNMGVTSFNGQTGAVSMTGDGGAVRGANNNSITTRLADASVTGVASFNSTDFGVVNGAVSSRGVTSIAVGASSFTGAVSITNGSNVTISTANNRITINAVIGATGDTIGATGALTANTISGVKVIDARLATPSLTGVASFDLASGLSAGSTGHVRLVSIPNTSLANSSFTLRDEVGATDIISLGETLTITGGRGVDFIRTATDTYEVRGVTATSSGVLGVASFNSTRFSVVNGAVDLAAPYQITGNTVVSGIAAGASALPGNIVAINNLGVTGIVIAGQTITGSVSLTGVGFYGLTGVTSSVYPTMLGVGFTGDRLLVATGPTVDPFRQYVKFGNAWVQTGVVGIGQGPAGATGTPGTAGDRGFTGPGYTGATILGDGTLQVTFAYWTSGGLVETSQNLGTVKGATGATGNRGSTGANGVTGGRGYLIAYNESGDPPFQGIELDGLNRQYLNFQYEFMSDADKTFIGKYFDIALQRAGGEFLFDRIGLGLVFNIYSPNNPSDIVARFRVDAVGKQWTDYESEYFEKYQFYGQFLQGTAGSIITKCEPVGYAQIEVEQDAGKPEVSGIPLRWGLTGGNIAAEEPGAYDGWVAPFKPNAIYVEVSNLDTNSNSLTGQFSTWATVGKGTLVVESDEPYSTTNANDKFVYNVNYITVSPSGLAKTRFYGNILSGTTGDFYASWIEGIGNQHEIKGDRVRLSFIPAGATGSPGARGETGTVSLTGYSPYSGFTHDTSGTFDSYSNIKGRKYLYMTEDGGITWDYIRPYDIYNQKDFEFDTLSFTYNGATTRRRSINNYSLAGTEFATTYRVGNATPGGTAHIVISQGGGVDDGINFPLRGNNAGSTIFDTSSASISGNPADRSVVVTLTATGQDFDGSIANATARTITFILRNDYLYGLTNAAFLTGGNGVSGIDWTVSRPKNGLSADFGLVSSYPRNETIDGFNKTVTTAETGVVGDYYIYIAYPARLHVEGISTRLGSSTANLGGMKLQGPELLDIGTGVSTVEFTNEQGFKETYKIWRSDQKYAASEKPSFYMGIFSS